MVLHRQELQQHHADPVGRHGQRHHGVDPDGLIDPGATIERGDGGEWGADQNGEDAGVGDEKEGRRKAIEDDLR